MFSRFAILLLCAAMLSCGSDESKTNRCFLTGMVLEDDANGFTFTSAFQYEGNKLSSATNVMDMEGESSDYSSSSVFTYDVEGRLSEIETDVTEFGGSRQVFTYDEDGNLESKEEFNDDSELVAQWLYTYNSSGQKIEMTTSYSSDEVVIVETFSYPNPETKNPSSGSLTVNGDEPGKLTYTFEYDNHPTPHGYFLDPTLPQNNVTKTTISMPDEEAPYVLTTSYVYNDQGYPVSSLRSDGMKHTFTYNCK